MPVYKKDSSRLERQTRRAYLLAQLKVQVSVLCESHRRRSARRIDETLSRVLRTAIELKTGRPRRGEREAFVEHLLACSYHGEPYVELSKEVGESDLVHVSGVFDVTELAKHFIWSNDAPKNVKVVGEGDGA